LFLVIERQAEAVAERCERSLGCVGLSGFERHVVRFAWIKTGRRAKARAFADDDMVFGANDDAYASEISALGLSVSALALIQQLVGQGDAIPTVETENPVRLGDRVPAFDIGNVTSVLLAGFDPGVIELGLETFDLEIGEAHSR
jgi:hypothetical protein